MKENVAGNHGSPKDLADGVYKYKAVVTDAAGNTSETAVQKWLWILPHRKQVNSLYLI